MTTRFSVVVPARFGSTRLPGKPLLQLKGKPMVVWVAERAAQSEAQELLIATDHDEIERVVQDHGFEAIRTRTDHASGTDRLCETARLKGWAEDHIVVNVQGDEPLIEPSLINAVAALLASRPDCAIATAAYPIQDAREAFNPNAVKVVCGRNGQALYFSRAPIPFVRDSFSSALGSAAPAVLPEGHGMLRHVGIYAYRVAFLRQYGDLEMTPLERSEALEQLRALENGFRIAVHITDTAPAPGIDTAEDIERVLALLD